MRNFFDAFNELPKPPFFDKLPPLATVKAIAPHLPEMLLAFIQQSAGPAQSTHPLSQAKSSILRGAIVIAETIFNKQIYNQPALAQAKAGLVDSAIKINIKEVGEPITLVFSESQVDILVNSEYDVDCELTTNIKTLLKLKDKQQLTTLLKDGTLDVVGDISVLQKLNQFIEKIEPGVGAILSPVIGDLAAGMIEAVIKSLISFVMTNFQQTKTWAKDGMTEGLQILPHENATRYAKS